MKKLYYLSLCTICALTFSCRKKYTCACEYMESVTLKNETGDTLAEPKVLYKNFSHEIRDRNDVAAKRCEGSNDEVFVSNTQTGDTISSLTTTTICKLKK